MSLKERLSRRAREEFWSALEKTGLSTRRAMQLIGTNGVSADDLALLDVMRRDNAAAPSPFRASPIWKDLARRLERWFILDGLREVEDHEMNAFFSSPLPNNPKLLRYACWMLYQNLKSRDKFGLLSKVAATADPRGPLVFDFENHLVSWDLLISLDTIMTIAERDDRILTEQITLGEIGAGWGRIGYVLKRLNPNATYIVMDLPEVLLVTQTYLPSKVGRCRVLGYVDAKASNLSRAELLQYDLVFLGSHDLDRLHSKSLDFVVNVASFQEMTKLQVSQYLGLIDDKLKGLLYTQQLLEAHTHGYDQGEITGSSSYEWPKGWECQMTRSAAWSDLYFEAIFKVC